ncbi:PEPxxWA-CTERM sorting domain-containing protein [Rhizobium johnstonii]
MYVQEVTGWRVSSRTKHRALDLAAYDAMGWNLSVDALTYGARSTGSIYTQFAVAVPETATWGMMILGFGLVGGAMRRRSAPKVTFTA